MKCAYCLTLYILLIAGCSAVKSGVVPQAHNAIPTKDAWVAKETSPIAGTRLMTRVLPKEAMPESVVRPIQLSTQRIEAPNARPFDLISVKGLQELEGSAFIIPRLYVSGASSYGSAIAYDGEDGTSVLSLPVALLNGLETQIPTVSGAVASIPKEFVMKAPEELRNRFGDSLQTLPVCPKSFTLRFRGRMYTAESPMRSNSLCPVNKFFRIEFEGPSSEIKALLEAGAAVDEAVILGATLEYAVELPRTSYELWIDGSLLWNRLKATGEFPIASARRVQDVLVKTVLKIAQESGVDAWYSPSVASALPLMFYNLFDQNTGACGNSKSCYELKANPEQLSAVELSWRDNVQITQAVQFTSAIALGPTSNVSGFEINPSGDSFALAEKPASWRDLTWPVVIGLCEGLRSADAAVDADIKQYCRAVDKIVEKRTSDGYSNLGSNIQVFPGAWIRLDIKDIEEFTSAKYQTMPGGRIEAFPEIVKLGGDVVKDIKCLEGSNIACEEYHLRDEPLRTSTGELLYNEVACNQGESGCTAVEVGEGDRKERLYRKKVLQYRPVREFICDPADKYEYCPYFRVQKEKVASDLEYECQKVAKDKKWSFLCIGGCQETEELECKVKSDKAVMQDRQVPNCIGFDPENRSALPAEVGCSNPKYKCKRWSSSCKKYSVNEAMHLVWEEAYQRWKPMNLHLGEYPNNFLDEIELKFEGPRKSVAGCKLSKFERKVRGNVFFFKIPDKSGGQDECGQALWDDSNTTTFSLPILKVKSTVTNTVERGCGRTEFIVSADEVPMTQESTIVPSQFSYKQTVRIGPVENSCRHSGSYRVGDNQAFLERSPVRIRGSIAVLGDVLEAKAFSGASR